MNNLGNISTRASRDGHYYHEVFVALQALELLSPQTMLRAISMEGLSKADRERSSEAADEIADFVLYYAKDELLEPSVVTAEKTVIVQCKYSAAENRQHLEFCRSDALKTLQKFAKAFNDFKKYLGLDYVGTHLFFQLITNRPINADLCLMLQCLGKNHLGEVETRIHKEADDLRQLLALTKEEASVFAQQVKLCGSQENLSGIQALLFNRLQQLSATDAKGLRDIRSRLQDLVRDKAGMAGAEGKNIIGAEDVLSAIGVYDRDECLPCSSRFPVIDKSKAVHRKQMALFVDILKRDTPPVVLHAAGGVGKTFFMQQAAEELSQECEVVLFDCFAGGAFSMLEDRRHLPERGLVHIVNELAFRGLCEPILPTQVSSNIFKVCRERLKQVSKHCRRVVLLLDAVDNSVSITRFGQYCFPVELLNSLARQPIEGVSLAVSCRTERKEAVEGNASCRVLEMRLEAFSLQETACFVKAHRNDAGTAEITASFVRTEGNARALAYLLAWKADWEEIKKSDKKILVSDIIARRIKQAVSVAEDQGALVESKLLLRCLSVLPPPIPLQELSLLTGLSVATLKTFSAEMGYLLDKLPQGIMFRDEDGLTYVQHEYPCTEDIQNQLVSRLENIQDTSVYATRILPAFLLSTRKGERLFELAKMGTVPKQLSSRTGLASIRSLRVNAALEFAVQQGNTDQLLQLLVVRSRFIKDNISEIEYLLNYPDLLSVIKDEESVRLLAESKRISRVEKHSGLAVYYFLTNNLKDAWLHVEEALRYWNQGRRPSDAGKVSCSAAIAFCFLMSGKQRQAVAVLNGSPWQSAQRMCCYARELVMAGNLSGDCWAEALLKVASAEVIAAAIPYFGFSKDYQTQLCKILANKLQENKKLNRNDDKDATISKPLYQKITGVALRLKLKQEARFFVNWLEYECSFTRKSVQTPQWFDFAIFFKIAVSAACTGDRVRYQDIVPQELSSLCKGLLREKRSNKFWDAFNQRICEQGQRSRVTKVRRAADYFEFWPFDSLYEIIQILSTFYACSGQNKTKVLRKLVLLWQDEVVDVLSDETNEETDFFRYFFRQIAVWISWNLQGISHSEVDAWFCLVKQEVKDPFQWLDIARGLAEQREYTQLAKEAALIAETYMLNEAENVRQAEFYGELGRVVRNICEENAKEYFLSGYQRIDNQEFSDMSYLEGLQALMSKVKGREIHADAMLRASRLKEWEIPQDEPVDCLQYGPYMDGMVAASGLRYVAELSRWDDKGIAPLACTLIPFVTSLVRSRKVTPKEALILSRLVMLVDGEEPDVESFIRVLSEHPSFCAEAADELINQLLLSYPGCMYRGALTRLIDVTKRYLDNCNAKLQYLVLLSGDNRKLLSISEGLLPGSEPDEINENYSFSISINRERLIKRIKEALQDENTIEEGSLENVLIFREIANEFGISLPEVGKVLAKILIEHGNFDQQLYLKCAECLLPVASDEVLQQAVEWAFSSDLWWTEPEINWYVNGHKRLSNTFEEIGAGLLWRQLGALNAADRWRAAHSVRLAAKYGQWKLIDKLVLKIGSSSAGVFQDKRYKFFYLHARLWLLIALARMAIDYPKEISQYQTIFRIILQGNSQPHVLMRHFAAQAVLACHDGGATLPKMLVQMAAEADEPLPEHQEGREDVPPDCLGRQSAVQDEAWRQSYWDTRRDAKDKPQFQFDDEQFKYEWLDDLGRIFNLHYWQVLERFSAVAQKLDSAVQGTSETDNRQVEWELDERILDSSETYGEQLAWHALMITAGELQQSIPTVLKTRTLSCYGAEGTPWQRWLSQFVLRHSSGYWIADITDNAPESVYDRLHKQNDRDYCTVKLDTKTVRRLLGCELSEEHLVIRGNWRTEEDGVEVTVFSVLVQPTAVDKLIKSVLRDDPETASLPDVDLEIDSEQESIYADLCRPWIRCLKQYASLDDGDILGSSAASEFSIETRVLNEKIRLLPEPSKHSWKNDEGQVVVQLSTWGNWDCRRSVRYPFGTQLTCRTNWLRELLSVEKSELVLLIRANINFFENHFSHEPCSVNVVRIDKDLQITHYTGRHRGGYWKEK